MFFSNENPLRRRSAALVLVLGTVLLLLVGGTTAYTDVRGGADPTAMKVGNNLLLSRVIQRRHLGARGPDARGPRQAHAAQKGLVRQHRRRLGARDLDRGRQDLDPLRRRRRPPHVRHQRRLPPGQLPQLGHQSEAARRQVGHRRRALHLRGQRYLVWSGWAGSDNSEQNLYIAKMSSPTQATGARYIISQPREPWESKRDGSMPLINEGPEAIVDPNGQLHIVYSANGSWGTKYCLADLRLKKGGDPTNTWDWYKSNGCLFGSHQENMMPGWDATLGIDGPGHHTFALPNGDVNASPGGTNRIPFMFHGVAKGTPYNWGNRHWYTGSFVWWSNTKYSRKNVPGDNENVGFSFKFFEG
ncbi:alpha-L-arabinofuranosidase II [Apiospora arundinis]